VNEKYSIFHIDGGLGKHIAGTAVAQCIKNNYPDRKLIVVCAWVEPFLTLDFVDRVYKQGMTPYFYDDYVRGRDSLLFKGEPYWTTDHIYHRGKLVENWCKIFNLDYKGEKPSLVFNIRDKQIANNAWQSNKPSMIIQSNGGLYNRSDGYPYSWSRDMPISILNNVVSHFKDRYTIYQVCRKDSPVVNGVVPINEPMPNMKLLSILLNSKKRFLIDSSLQHGASALNLPSTVIWIATSPEVFGYDIHDNICARVDKGKLIDSYIFDYNFDGVTHECPYLEDDFFSIDEIIESLESN